MWLQAKFLTCCKTLTAYCRNVYTSIDDPAKRRINLENKAFQSRVAALPGGRDFLAEVGFEVRLLSTPLPAAALPRHACHPVRRPATSDDTPRTELPRCHAALRRTPHQTATIPATPHASLGWPVYWRSCSRAQDTDALISGMARCLSHSS